MIAPNSNYSKDGESTSEPTYRTFPKQRNVSMTQEEHLEEQLNDTESWTLDELKTGRRANDQQELDEQIAPLKTIGQPVTRRVGMTRRPMTAVFQGQPSRQPSSDVTVGSTAPAHVSAGRHLSRRVSDERHRTRQPSSDVTLGAAAPDHIGAAGRPRRHARNGSSQRRRSPRAYPRYSPARRSRQSLAFEQQLINELAQLRHENERLRQVNAERTRVLAMSRSPAQHAHRESADSDAGFFLPRYLRA